MSDPSELSFKVRFVDPDLSPEEHDEQARRLLRELKDMEEVEDIRPAVDPNPPEGHKSFGGFVAGLLDGRAEAATFQSVYNYIGERSAAKGIEIEIERNGRKLKVSASTKTEMEEVLPLLEKYLAETETPPDPTVQKILVLAAVAETAAKSRLDEEIRDIQEGLVRSQFRDQIVMEPKWALEPRDIHRAMLEVKPNIVHFSGLVGLEDGDHSLAGLMSDGVLQELFAAFEERVDCVIINGCESEAEAGAIARHIDYVIGMQSDLTPQAAIEFAVGFYDALGAGESIELAFKLGCHAIRLAQLPGADAPILKVKSAA